MAEILRPSFVRKAFHLIEPSRPSRLIVFIDDLDGLRKVPENVPNREATQQYLGVPVSKIPDPFGCCASFADHMIGLLGGFLAPVEVEYELVRAAEMYSSGRFDEGLKLILEKHAEIIAIIAPTLREENRAGWSPFMPICPKCGQVVERAVTAYHPERGTIEFTCEKSAGGTRGCGFSGEQSVLGGKAKVQWKVDWALRWYVLKVDYELYGKDLTDSARLSGQILRVMGARAPLGFPFEMFLDEEGHKVSKSVGRGVTVDQWTRYAPIEVLKYFLLLNPRRARKLFLEAIPQYVDEYLDAVREYAAASEEQRRESILEYVIQSTTPRRFNSALSFGLMMNLVAALGSSDRDFIWNYIVRYDPSIAGDRRDREDGPRADGMRAEFLSRFYRADQTALHAGRCGARATDNSRDVAARKPRTRAPKKSKRKSTIWAAKITTSPARFSRCYIARFSASSAAPASARSSGSPRRQESSSCSTPRSRALKRIRRRPSPPSRGRGRSA